ncbi:MAG: glycosyltransferase 87 family protein [Alphaproteobacteria bacterium]
MAAASLGVLAGLLYLLLPFAIQRTALPRNVLFVGVLAGLLARLFLFASEPILENDYFRYLWDGAVLASGENPYRWSPADVLTGIAPAAFHNLSVEAGQVVAQIGYPDLRTIYPPLGVLIFGLAHLADPWGLTGLRGLYLLADTVTLALLLALLRQFGRPPVWALIYWLNPLSIQMTFNAMHMDALLLPFLLGAFLLAVRNRPGGATFLLVLAAGVKLWPVLLAPVLLRHAAPTLRQTLVWMLLFAAGFVVLLLPLYFSGPAETSGLFAYGSDWRKNEIVFGLVVSLFDGLLAVFDAVRIDAERLARLAVAGALTLLALLLALLARPKDDRALAVSVLMLVACLFIFVPSPYPWYFIWLLPFLSLVPMTAILCWTATLPLYQLRFHSYFMDNDGMFENGIVWLEHGVPITLIIITLLIRIVRR